MGWKTALAARDAGLSGALSDRARLALDHMCWTVRDVPTDDTPAAEYFEGSVSLGVYLIGSGRTHDTYKKAGARALAELAEAGLIEPVGPQGARRKQHWRILVGDRWAPPQTCGQLRPQSVDNPYLRGPK